LEEDQLAFFPLILKRAAIDWYDTRAIQKISMEELLTEFTQFFCPTYQDRVINRETVFTNVYHAIDTGDADPIRKRPYRQSPEMMKEMKRQVKEMVKAEIVEKSNSLWSSPCLLIKKAGVNKYRFVNDLRAVNKLTKPVYWPMPTMADIFDTVAESNNF